ncbi:MAG: FAD-dependent oxidoreductase [Thermomicrobiales bacterium]
MAYDSEYLVIGAGAMGSAAAWHLARRGKAPLLLEQFELNHTKGASHGQTRNFNPAYPDPDYIALLKEAFTLYRELETDSGMSLLSLVGLINIAPEAENAQLRAKTVAGGIESTLYGPDEAAERWPGWRFEQTALFFPQAGPVRADDTLRAFHGQIRALGGTILPNTRVTAIEINDDDAVVRTEDRAYRVKRVIVAAGGWSAKLLGDRLPPLRVTQEQPAHFPLIAPTDELAWPSFNHRPADGAKYGYWRSGIYGLISPGEGLKVGWHAVGQEVDPDRRDFLPEPEQLKDLQRYVEEWIPGVDWTQPAPISCTYTLTEDEHFILDREGPVTVAAGFSGHGFKFTPAIGRVLADLAEFGTPAPETFRLGPDRPGVRRRRS